ncbi:hypothetical protein QVD17_08012 [Tagetes erecta]|uniref:Uncharacterized protein n=1 Tax=Tagetes erecta TaxID=13708 RepID=A0AAD8P4D3_TARER|nr:hypothetical protein QVD17_08012 [Tagetes erecta]
MGISRIQRRHRGKQFQIKNISLPLASSNSDFRSSCLLLCLWEQSGVNAVPANERSLKIEKTGIWGFKG